MPEVTTGFTVSEEDRKKVTAWLAKHREEKHADMFRDMGDGKKIFYTGAIGGGLTYEYTPTSLGTVFKATCHCGEALDLSDYDSW